MRRILVNVRPNSSQESIEPAADGHLTVKVNAPARDGKANKRVIELLSKYLGVPKSKIALVSGGKSKTKTFQIVESE
ncbi:MAG: DUF167 domain-containing protein [Pseudomonadota bacterium]